MEDFSRTSTNKIIKPSIDHLLKRLELCQLSGGDVIHAVDNYFD